MGSREIFLGRCGNYEYKNLFPPNKEVGTSTAFLLFQPKLVKPNTLGVWYKGFQLAKNEKFVLIENYGSYQKGFVARGM